MELHDNPYAPPKGAARSHPRDIPLLLWFILPIYPTYLLGQMMFRGPTRVLNDFSTFSLGHLNEALLVTIVGSMAGTLTGVRQDYNLERSVIRLSRTFGGIVFGCVFIVCQPYLLPYVRNLTGLLELALPRPLSTWFNAIMYDQPYIILPTILVAGFSAWTIEYAVRSIWKYGTSLRTATNNPIDPSGGSGVS